MIEAFWFAGGLLIGYLLGAMMTVCVFVKRR